MCTISIGAWLSGISIDATEEKNYFHGGYSNVMHTGAALVLYDSTRPNLKKFGMQCTVMPPVIK